MPEFLKSQLDYIFFFYGAAFLLLIPTCLFLRRRSNSKLHWIWLAWFGAIHGANEWLDLLAFSLEPGLVFDYVRLGFLVSSFVCLVEFGRASTRTICGRGPGRWILGVMVALAGVGGLAGLAGLFVASRYVLGLVGGLWAAASLFLAAKTDPSGSRPLQMGALGMASYALAAGLVVNPAPFFPASWLNYDSFFAVAGIPIQLIRGLMAVSITASLCLLAQTCFERDDHASVWYHHLMLGAIAGVGLLLITGWFFTYQLGDITAREKWDDYEHDAGIVRQLLTDTMAEADRLVQTISGLPEICSFLASKAPQTIQPANNVLDVCSQTLPESVCYLMNLHGLTIASSNRDRPDSFLGNAYAFRPYFQQAVQGSPGSYWALGVTSKELGYYASFPVRDHAKQIIGAVVIKKALVDVQAALDNSHLCLIIDRRGIVIMSNRPEMILRSLWPLTPVEINYLLVSRQFGGGPFTPILPQKPMDKSECPLEGKRQMVLVRPIPGAGFSVVVFGSLWPVAQARLLGISATLLLCLALIGFLSFVVIMRENEEGFRQLFENAADILILHDKGKIIKVNHQACQCLGYTENELLGLSIFDIEVGFSKEFLIDLWRKGGNVVTLSGTYRRKDGSAFPTEIRAGEITYHGQTLRLAAVRDVTVQKEAEEALRATQENYRHLASQLLTAQETERRLIARELHDDLSQRLAILAMDTEELENQMSPSGGDSGIRLKAIKNKIVKLSVDTHTLSRRLHPSILDDLGLADAVVSELAAFRQREGIAVTYRIAGIPAEIGQDVALCIYRILQESLRNIAKHSSATEVNVSLFGQNNSIHMVIKDNGTGFEPDKVKIKPGMGLASMKERAYLVGGNLSIQSQPGKGTVIEAVAPSKWSTS